MNSADTLEGAKDIIYDSYLGLAIERPPEGTTTHSLWEIITI